MESTFKITIDSMLAGNVDGLTDVVKKISYTITATKEDLSISSSIASELPNPTDTDFIPFEDLTEEQVVNWVNSLEQTKFTKQYLVDQLEKRIQESSLQTKRAPWLPPIPVYPLPPNPTV